MYRRQRLLSSNGMIVKSVWITLKKQSVVIYIINSGDIEIRYLKASPLPIEYLLSSRQWMDHGWDSRMESLGPDSDSHLTDQIAESCDNAVKTTCQQRTAEDFLKPESSPKVLC